MQIKITDKSLRFFLKTAATPTKIMEVITRCGPTIDNIEKTTSDCIYDIEVITNRIDTANTFGFAREVFTILNQQGINAKLLNNPYHEKISFYSNLSHTFHFEISDASLTPRFTAVSLENISISPSPQKTQDFLSNCGQRPINNAVDITNELTILYGIPSHIFDLDKLATQKLTIRQSVAGETVFTLDGKNNKLQGGDIIIEDGAGRLVDLCGVMGGSIAEVDQYTKNILFIVPVYNPSRVRRTSLYLQNRTLASQIYEKQPDPELCLPVLKIGIDLFSKRAKARVSSPIFNSQLSSYTPKSIHLDINWVNRSLGININRKSIVSILNNLGFSPSLTGEKIIDCVIPSWRQFDIKIKEDLLEEIARVYGYFLLPPSVPCVTLAPESKDSLLLTESKIKNFLSINGFNEIYNSSLTSAEAINKASLSLTNHIKLQNSLSVEYEYLRLSLTPSILENIKNNQAKFDTPINIFEVSNTYHKTKTGLPDEIAYLVLSSPTDYLTFKGILELLLLHLNIKGIKFTPSKIPPEYYSKETTADITHNGKIIGNIGSLKPKILYNFCLKTNPLIAEIDITQLSKLIDTRITYEPISEYPDVIEEITISSTKLIGQIIDTISGSNKLIKKVIYTGSYKNKHSFKLVFSSIEKNLTQVEINKIRDRILSCLS